MAVISVSDNFNRANEVLNKSGGNWVCNSLIRPTIVSNQVESPGGVSFNIHKDRNAGLQRSRIVLKQLATATTTKGGVIVGAYNSATTPGSTYNWYANEAFFYVKAQTTGWTLYHKSPGPVTLTTLGTYNTAPAVNDSCELTYDPATGALELFVNDVSRISVTTTPLGSSYQGIGFHVEDGTIVDTWTGSWGEPDPPPPSSTSVDDHFNRADNWIGVNTNWSSTSTTNPQIISNQLGSTAAGLAVHNTFYSGKQKVEAVLKANNSAGSIRSYVVAGIENTTPAFSIGPWYRVGVRASDYILQVKANGNSTHSTVSATGNPYVPVGGPQPNDKMGITYDPDTGTVEMFINDVLRASATLTPLSGNHSRVGIGVEAGNLMDDFHAEWNTSDPPISGWQFYELQGDLTTELPLFVTEWNGSTESAISMIATEEYSGGGGGGSNFPLQTVYWSDEVVEGYGINTAFSRPTTAGAPNSNILYSAEGQSAAIRAARRTWVADKLAEMNVRYVRDRLMSGDVNDLDHFNILWARGIKASVNVMTEAADTGGTMSAAMLNNVFGYIVANKEKIANVQGWNEPNKGPGLTSQWAQYTRNHQKIVWDEFRARNLHNYTHVGPYAEKMYVQGPALMDDSSAQKNIVSGPNGAPAYADLRATDIANYMDRGNWHRYPLQSTFPTAGGTATYPENNYEREQWASDTYGGKELDWTEYGIRHNVDEQCEAAYHVRLILDSYLRGTHRLFQFDFLDDNDGASWGLWKTASSSTSHASWTPYVSYGTIKDLLTKFDDGGRSTKYVPPKIGLKLEYTDDSSLGTATNGGLRWGIFSKANGSKFLVMWRLMRLQTTSGARVSVPAMNVTVKTDGTPSGLTVPVKGFPIAVNINASNVITGTENLTPIW